MSCDCSEPDCMSVTPRRARKEHVCVECKSRIRIAQDHIQISGVWDGEPASFRLCQECDAWRQGYYEHVRIGLAEERKTHHANRFVPMYSPYASLCDCLEFGGLKRALREFSIEVYGYDPKET